MAQATYADDLTFLRQHADVAELTAGGPMRAAVAPAWQGRVLTSTLAGGDGPSFGWLNRPFIAAGREGPAFNNYGGEDRFWLGPEGGQFGLWFAKGDPFDLEHWRTPPELNSGPFEVADRTETSVTMARRMRVVNYAGTVFDCAVRRTVSLLDAVRAAELLCGRVPPGMEWVGVESQSTLTNAGGRPWVRDGGLLSIWILGQFNPLPRGRVIAPFRQGSVSDFGPEATTNYFGRLPTDRCSIFDNCILFTCDGRYRSKIGLSPIRSKGVIGSYDPDGGVLTIVTFNQPLTAAELPYVNSLWRIQENPFAGDVINSYNDGEAAPGAGQLGPFYEIETSSPAAVLKPGGTIIHCHRTFHFRGPVQALNAISLALLDLDLADLPA